MDNVGNKRATLIGLRFNAPDIKNKTLLNLFARECFIFRLFSSISLAFYKSSLNKSAIILVRLYISLSLHKSIKETSEEELG